MPEEITFEILEGLGSLTGFSSLSNISDIFNFYFWSVIILFKNFVLYGCAFLIFFSIFYSIYHLVRK